jgi:hypothetical protein
VSPPKAAGGPDVATRTAEPTRNRESSRYHRVDGFAAPTAADRADAELLAYAALLGYRLTVRCLDCRRWLADPVSVAAHRGPTCRARAEEVVV